jgi:hypothetical protein
MKTTLAWGAVALTIAAALLGAGSAAGIRALRPCSARDLRPLGGMLQGATGSMVGPVRFRNVSSSTCTVGGRPHVEINDRSGTLLPTRERALSLDQIGERQVHALRPYQRAELYLAWSNWCGSWPRATLVRTLFLRTSLSTGTKRIAAFRSGRPRCDVRTGSTLAVTPFGVPR